MPVNVQPQLMISSCCQLFVLKLRFTHLCNVALRGLGNLCVGARGTPLL